MLPNIGIIVPLYLNDVIYRMEVLQKFTTLTNRLCGGPFDMNIKKGVMDIFRYDNI